MATVSEGVDRARLILQDQNAVNTARRWKDAELVLWFNDALTQVVMLDPSTNPVTETYTLIAGARQSLTADAVVLLDVVKNTTGRQIRMADRAALDAMFPDWQDSTEKDEISNVMYDPKDRQRFWTYPPALAGTQIDLVVSKYFPTVTLVSPFPLSLQYLTPCVDYVCYKAYSKEGEATNVSRAAAHLGLFNESIGAITARYNPQTTGT